MLTELARQVGLALHNVQLDSALQAILDELRQQADELQASRARIVAAGDAERRKLERNLHDGAQQHLVALAVKLRLARDIVDDDPATPRRCSTSSAGDVQETIQELRELAHGIYPPLLVDSGLAEALRAAATGRRSRPPSTPTASGATPSEIEAAVYFCCLEAMQNAAKHAGEGATRAGPDLGGAGGLLLRGQPTTAPASTPTGAAAGPRLRQHGATASAPSAAPSAGSRSPGTARRSRARSR